MRLARSLVTVLLTAGVVVTATTVGVGAAQPFCHERAACVAVPRS